MSTPCESVVIDNFWSRQHGRPIVFHRRWGAQTKCGLDQPYACGHALPRDVAEQIAQPCGRCYRDTPTSPDLGSPESAAVT